MKEKSLKPSGVQHRLWVLAQILIDVVCVAFASACALLLRFEISLAGVQASGYLETAIRALPMQIVATILFLALFRCYSSMWQFAGLRDLLRVVWACLASVVSMILVMYFLEMPMPRSYPILHGMFLVIFIGGLKLLYRLVWEMRHESSQEKKRTMIVGAGMAGATLLREFQTSEQSANEVVCVVDDDRSKKGRDLRGVKIVGNRYDIPVAALKYKVEEIVFAIAAAEPSVRREILDLCRQTGCEIKVIPALYQLVNGDVSIQRIRKLQIEDLLGRDSVHVDSAGIGEFVAGKVVLVTGGGGSIGSELCRQLAALNPKLLIIFDIYENNAYDIQQELKRKYPELPMEVLIGSVRDEKRMAQLFEKYRPQLVYHAAAHKHVPLMEDSPMEAVKNNVFGTLNTAVMADRYGAEKMVLISTDKAVNPTNIMGASKRICEMIVEMVGRHSETDYVAVRFGNVLGSNGSVIPLFQKQIAEGGPVTVTDKRIIRYFMTIPEAVSLVLQAGVYATGGEIFILDMGEPVKIDDLARNMIRLSGFEPDVDIPVVYTGLRPGEKLYEELLLQSEGMRKTENDLIFIVQDEEFDDDELKQRLETLRAAAEVGDRLAVRKLMHQIVPEFQEQKAETYA